MFVTVKKRSHFFFKFNLLDIDTFIYFFNTDWTTDVLSLDNVVSEEHFMLREALARVENRVAHLF